MNAQWINLNGPAGQFQAYLSLPPSGSGPGVLLLQEIFGVNTHIQAVADQYALAGFVVLAPDVFWQQSPRVSLGYTGSDRDQALALAKAAQPAALLSDLQAAALALRERPEVSASSGRIASLGYCMGGRLAYLAACAGWVDAGVGYYGGGIADNLAAAAALQRPLQLHYGGRDAMISAAAVQATRQALAGKAAHIHVYEAADHGFNCWARASHHAPSAALAHGRSLQFLAEHLF